MWFIEINKSPLRIYHNIQTNTAIGMLKGVKASTKMSRVLKLRSFGLLLLVKRSLEAEVVGSKPDSIGGKL